MPGLCSTGDQTQGILHTKQVLYQLSYIVTIFFKTRSYPVCQANLKLQSPTFASTVLRLRACTNSLLLALILGIFFPFVVVILCTGCACLLEKVILTYAFVRGEDKCTSP